MANSRKPNRDQIMASKLETKSFDKGLIKDEKFKKNKAALIKLLHELSEAYRAYYTSLESHLSENKQTRDLLKRAKDILTSLKRENPKEGTTGLTEDLVTNEDLHTRFHELIAIINVGLLSVPKSKNDKSEKRFIVTFEKFKDALKTQDKILKKHSKDLFPKLGTSDRFLSRQGKYFEILRRAYRLLISEHEKRISEIKEERNDAGWFEKRMVLKNEYENSQFNKYAIYLIHINYNLA